MNYGPQATGGEACLTLLALPCLPHLAYLKLTFPGSLPFIGKVRSTPVGP